MRISAVVATGLSRQIGIENDLPWRIPAELKNFKEITLGGALLMGRKTFESIGKPLPGRKTIVLTRSADWSHPGVEVAGDLESAIELALSLKVDDLYVVGGGEIYKQALPFCERLYLTKVDYDGPGDTYFPEYEDSFSLLNEKNNPATSGCPRWTLQVWTR